MEVSDQLQARDALSPENRLRYSMDGRLGGPQSWSGRYGEENNLAPAGGSSPGRPARSPSVYRLRIGRPAKLKAADYQTREKNISYWQRKKWSRSALHS
jgi:hypothetical protein